MTRLIRSVRDCANNWASLYFPGGAAIARDPAYGNRSTLSAPGQEEADVLQDCHLGPAARET